MIEIALNVSRMDLEIEHAQIKVLTSQDNIILPLKKGRLTGYQHRDE